MADKKLRVGVLISGSGTNLQSIIDAAYAGEIDVEVAVVISNRQEARGLERAEKAHIPGVWIDRTAHKTFHSYNMAIRDALKEHKVDLVVMAGYMRLLGTEVLKEYPNRVINIHPALLPSFPGASGIQDAFDYGVKLTGVTVHFANEKFDDGPIIAQMPVRIAEDDAIEDLEAKIHAIEHRLYPEVLQMFAQGRVSIEGRIARIAPHPSETR
ncbi:MAG: phosphoribosylglycinamide formyltransferase [Actinomycetota bacterium]|jgi:phosphoribosylglycinamide formyltransferase-1|nr:phosphoribosylglycinamide formyltransferase [Actinomycetota bacterium]